jgi:hypothetical protein
MGVAVIRVGVLLKRHPNRSVVVSMMMINMVSIIRVVTVDHRRPRARKLQEGRRAARLAVEGRAHPEEGQARHGNIQTEAIRNHRLLKGMREFRCPSRLHSSRVPSGVVRDSGPKVRVVTETSPHVNIKRLQLGNIFTSLRT